MMHPAIYHLLFALIPVLTFAQRSNNHVTWYAGYFYSDTITSAGAINDAAKASGNCKDNGLYAHITKLTVSYLTDQLRQSNSFSETLPGELNKTVIIK